MYGSLEIPEWIQTTDDRERFREFVYPAVNLRSQDTALFRDRTILSSTNDAVERFNDEIAELRNAASREYFSHDEVRSQETGNVDDYTPEYLRQITCQGIPMGILRLQVGMPVMLLRNYYPRLGLCNGTRLIITRLYNRCVKVKIISQDPRFNGNEHFISRISLTTDKKLPFPMVRKQIPLRPCFSMTINKSQGQTLKIVGVDLTTPVFAHGQLYVALSRVTDVRNLMILLPPRTSTTNNVVYPEVLMRPDDREP
ncbi:hypothetical protein EPUL_006455 [Erysiphe pulchra]|uniref:DNA helicase Pif1-like 2B domain-containing protein n=1 Tax=Erysiphe pulchra TaxID=225359 RepID=A0A2S4PHW5_9PEZI|nr:hypothetical protein EPUL_006455 [Erysiphe pulchra]